MSALKENYNSDYNKGLDLNTADTANEITLNIRETSQKYSEKLKKTMGEPAPMDIGRGEEKEPFDIGKYRYF